MSSSSSTQLTEAVQVRDPRHPYGTRPRMPSVDESIIHVRKPQRTQKRISYEHSDLQEVTILLPEEASNNGVTSGSVELSWQKVGAFMDLSRFHCQRLYAKAGGGSLDLGLFYDRGTFYAMGAWCGHMGGPLFEGDIEDLNGRAHVMCPWHSYMFDLESGKNNLGMEQTVHRVKVEDGQVYVLYSTELSTKSFRGTDDG